MVCTGLHKCQKQSTSRSIVPSAVCGRSVFAPPKQVKQLYMLSRIESHLGISVCSSQ